MACSYIRRIFILFCFIVLVCTFLSIKLCTLALYDNPSEKVLSGQYTRKNVVSSHTGFVYDRNLELLSHRTNAAFAIVNPAASYDKNDAINFICENSDYDFEEIFEKFSNPEPFYVHLTELPQRSVPKGIYVYDEYEYEDNNLCRHVLGYKDKDGKGRDGIYARFDSFLNNTGSLSYSYTSDAVGNIMNTDGFCIINDGYTDKSGIVLTIDKKIQSKIDNICDKYMDMGAVVVSEIATGDILALSSRPLYDSQDVAAFLDSEKAELVNRAFALYTPGSVFKSVVCTSALTLDEALFDFEYECTGKCDVAGKEFKCHNTSGHGTQTMKNAYANSCNTYFIKLAEKVGFEWICSEAERMGLGRPNIIDGIYVKEANMPDRQKSYPKAYMANFSFGQGSLLVSAVDMVNIYSICATGQKRQLSLVKGIYDAEKQVVLNFEKEDVETILQSSVTCKLREMMKECVENGTGKGAGVAGVELGGKTATAQSGQIREGKEVLHKWFVGVFPIDEPKYTIAVLCDGNSDKNISPAIIFSDCVKAVLGYKNKSATM